MKRNGAAELVIRGMEMADQDGLEVSISKLEDIHRKLSDALITAAQKGEPTAHPFFGDGQEWLLDLDEALTALKGMR